MNLRKLIIFIKTATIVALGLLGLFNIVIYTYNLVLPDSESTMNTTFLIMGLIYLVGAFLISRFKVRR